jgi:hypothetical protein
VAGHAQALADAAGRRAGTDGTGGAVAVGLTVGLGTAGEVVALDAAGKAAPLRFGDDIDDVALLEDIGAQPLTDLVIVRVVDADLAQVTEVAQALEVSLHRLCHALALAETELDGVVAVLLFRLDLDDDARASLDDRHATRLTAGRKDLRHAYLAAENCFCHSQFFRPSLRTVTGTPGSLYVVTCYCLLQLDLDVDAGGQLQSLQCVYRPR